MLPEGLEFLKPGWWLVHIVSVVLVYVYGYRKGRRDEKKQSRARRPPAPDATSPPSSSPPADPGSA